MMTNLFSVFDPTSSILSLPLNWLSTFLGILFLPMLYWAMPSRWALLWSKVLATI